MEGVTLIAIRHAKPESTGYADETLRPLSEEGKIVQRESLKQLKFKPDIVYSSPILRAMQTAEIVAEHFGIPLEPLQALGYQFDSNTLFHMLSKGGTICFVGHAPHLAEFVNECTGEASLPQGLSKSQAAVVQFEGVPASGKGRYIQ